MISVYVKHYLNQAGIGFLDKWFAEVYSHISKQEGFDSITFKKPTQGDCVNINMF